MESFPSAVDPTPSSVLFKETSTGSPRARVDELTALNRTRSGEAQHATLKLRRANTVAQGGNPIRRNQELKAKRERTAPTVVRARDSKGRLRKDALQRSQTQRDPRPAPPSGRRAGHFTVGSVGQNGKIFLRPIVNPAQKARRVSPPTFSPAQVNNGLLQPQIPARDDPSRWSSSQLSELRAPAREERPEQNYESAQPEYTSQRRRANSFSTISDKQSVSGADRRGELRIVIDRSEDRPKSAGGKTGHVPLEVPIPHYRLGTPRFNTEGSAVLQSSVYTRTSVSDNFRNSTLLGGMVDPLPSRLPSPFGRDRDSFSRGHPSFAISMFSGTAAIDLGRTSPVPRNSVVYELKGPVEPSIYETLVSDMDDGAVVRYNCGTKDISAATPARIVAQISSESFMDYELVSDFFLTFRSYLSTRHLLALLLARLQWAINRLQEDGRIIRIRTFAALRHWILNYFVDDFVTNYDLRTQFCDTINSLYQEVRSRRHGGMSDLKILIDLKRCWNGKCSVYWPGPDFSNAYNDPDLDLAPGSTEVELPSDAVPPQRVAFPRSGPVLSVDTDVHEILPPTQHDRNDSAATEQSIPFSTKSDQSTPALSCSLPPKSPKRQSVPLSRVKAPHPVQLDSNRSPASPHESPVSPILSRHHAFHGHGHKRSGSFSDSVRDDRAPMYAAEAGPAGPAQQEVFDPVGLIRGELYPPAESYMTMMAPDSPPLAPPSIIATPDRRSTPDGASKLVSSNSGMRTIIGSIKRALHTRNGGQSVSARMANAPEVIAMPTRSKTSALPTNVTFGSELYRDRKAPSVPKRPARIDLLCDEVLKQYRLREAMEEDAAQDIPHNPRTSGFQITVQEVSSNITEPKSPSAPVAGGSKTRSELTTGSGSIIIVGDDTGFDIPAMSGAGPDSAAYRESSHTLGSDDYLSSERTLSQRSEQTDDHSLLPAQDDAEDLVLTPQRLSFFYPTRPVTPRSHSSERVFVPHKKSSISLRLRKYASFQSGVSRHRFSMGSEAGLSALSSSAPSEKPVGPPLRRRPGGNLRQMQTGDEPKTPSARGSMVSHYTLDGSVLDSNAPTESGDASRPQSTLIPPNPRYSLLHRGAARNLRRSFEAAIARFAQIPDDPDGGIESALLKLEGKWEDASSTGQGSREHREHPLTPSGARKDVLPRRRQTDKSAFSTVAGRLAPPRPYSDSVAESEESYNSIPLLERGLTDESMKRPPTSRAPTSDIYGTPLSLMSSRDTAELVSRPSFQIVKETESIRRIPRGLAAPTSAPREVKRETPKRFSALSSDIVVIDSYDVAEARRSTGMHSLSESTVDIPPHPLAHPPSPPMTIQHPGSVISCASPLDKVLFQAQPLTPDTSPRRKNGENRSSRPRPVQHFSSDVLLISEKNRNMNPDHVPFILACESQVLAQQMTLVEMAALSEVDWRDLVEMRWGNGSPNICNWVEFLREQRKGIDLVVSRFNLMVRWVLSEIVLTRNLHERARTITKYIHTAVHARRMCNYATMLQIAVALSSSDCTRLQQTWQLVPAEDRRLFKDMECLIQPVRNFHDLRVEMETANLQEGCIPFIGLYVHDLTYNAQKPAQVPSNAGGLLVNFERYRTTARIVKNLLRLIDASTKYRFEPIQGIIERCLWIASLPEDEIQARSKELS
ncbi:hypothetical protein N7510_011220 [Penicillium lagena]|uniref:uncharacterized protein n=1 Tax=Penicillium lagena TaxID=94218 RepID=UPI002541E4F5|nr:uncharacterized protein N7510_011220 [Penicillium lagena]KAJ5601686.1 hypothetical protein N7510_011220 [Penicillium lagena]